MTRCVKFALAAVTLGASALADVTLYVDAKATGGGQTGANWQNAFLTIQEAIDHAHGNVNDTVDILVAEGTYSASTGATWNGTSTRDETLLLKSSASDEPIHIQGGYEGCDDGFCTGWGETNPDAPDGSFEDTILTGATDDNYHVIVADTVATNTLTADAVIDGFKVIGGKADGSAALDQTDGAGLYATGDSQVLVENVTFEDNVAENDGGAIYEVGSQDAHLHIKQCMFEGNVSKRGAGLFVYQCRDLRMANVDFHSNGNGVAEISGWPPVTTKGGAVFTYKECIVACSNGLFYGNVADRGGAVFVDP